MPKNNNLKDYLKDLYAGLSTVKPSASRDPQQFRSEIESLAHPADATATAADIRLDKTAYTSEGKVSGTIEDYDERTENNSFVYDTLTAKLRNELTNYYSEFIPVIPREAFQGCTNLGKANIPYTLEVGNYAFDGCTSLDTLTTQQLDSIGDYAFRNTKLRSVNFPYVTEVGSGAFMDCKALTSISIGTEATSSVD